MENTKLKSKIDNFGKPIKAPEGKKFFVKNTQYKTPEPSSRPVAPNQTGKAWKETIK